ncbi:MAG: toll/interleukin-1 receptor domain-containing protein [Flavobacteriales bacterium]|nr:toll/interleukin-1 receptor domain-containing protein [Flavobacteriales bacterium]
MKSKEVFVSYGRKDAESFTDALCERLVAEGFKIWRDIDEIHCGDNWTELIVKGIGESEVFIAILSQWAMRNPHSPCNNEIHEAASAGRPIIPVKINECVTHFHVRSRHIIEMHNWDVERQLTDGLDEIMHVIKTKDYPRNELLDLKNRIHPSDFTPEIEVLLRSFIGREQLIRSIEEALAGDHRIVLIEGDPGMGKSAIWADLVNRGVANAFYRCKFGDAKRSEPELFIRTIAYQLATDIDWYRKCIRKEQDLPKAVTDLANVLLVSPFTGYSEKAPCVIAIDALDEGLDAQEKIPIVTLLRELSTTLPPNIRFVITCRPDPKVRGLLPNPKVIRLKAEDPQNIADIDRYLVMRTHGVRFGEKVKDIVGMRATVARKSKGNFLFAVSMMNAIESGDLDPLAVPDDMKTYFNTLFNRSFPDERSWDAAAPILGLICASFKPLGSEAIAAILDIDPDDVVSTLARLPNMLHLEHGAYVPFHKSLIDWMLAPDDGQRIYHVKANKGHRAIIAYCQRQLKSGRPATHYELSRLPDHLMAVQDDDGLATLLSDSNMLDHSELGDPVRVRSLWALAFPLQGKSEYEMLIERFSALVGPEVPAPSEEVRLARLHKVALLFDRLELHAASKPLYERMIDMVERGTKHDPVDPGMLHLNLAIALRNLKEFERSDAEFINAGEMIKAAHGEKSPAHALWSYRYATLLWQAGKEHPEKETMWKRSNELYKHAASMLKDGPDPLLVPELLNDHSVLLDGMGDHEGSVRACEQGLALLETSGHDQGVTAAELHFNLGVHRHALYVKDFTKSLRSRDPLEEIMGHYIISKDLFAKVLGPESERVKAPTDMVALIASCQAVVDRFKNLVAGQQDEMIKMAIQPDTMNQLVRALILPRDLTGSFIDLYGKTKSVAFLRSIVDLECAILHFRNGEREKLMERFDPLLAGWKSLGVQVITSRLMIDYYIMLDQLSAHDRAKEVLKELLDLIYSGDEPDRSDHMLMVYLGYLKTHGTAADTVEVIDRIQSGRLYPQFRALSGLSRLKASILYTEGDFTKAAEQQEKFIKECFDDLEGGGAPVVYAIHALGLYQKSAGRFDDALATYQKALAIAKDECSDDRLMEPFILGNIASLYRDRGQLGPARENMNHVVEVVRDVHGGDHEKCAEELMKRASILILSGDYPQARNDLAQAMLTFETRYGAQVANWNTARSWELLGGLQHAEGRFDDSASSFELALVQYEGSFTSNRPIEREKVETLIAHGRMLRDRGSADATDRFKRAWTSGRKLFGDDHYLTLISRCWRRLTPNGETPDEDATELVGLIEAVEAISGPAHPQSLELRLEKAYMEGDIDGVKRAIDMIFEHDRPLFHLKAKAYAALGRLLIRASRLPEADMVLTSAIEFFERIRPGHPGSAECRTLMRDHRIE